jgi:hypothetical protein
MTNRFLPSADAAALETEPRVSSAGGLARTMGVRRALVLQTRHFYAATARRLAEHPGGTIPKILAAVRLGRKKPLRVRFGLISAAWDEATDDERQAFVDALREFETIGAPSGVREGW